MELNQIELRTVSRNERRAIRRIFVNGKDAHAAVSVDLTGRESHTLACYEWIFPQGPSGAKVRACTQYDFDNMMDLASYLRDRFDPELPF